MKSAGKRNWKDLGERFLEALNKTNLRRYSREPTVQSPGSGASLRSASSSVRHIFPVTCSRASFTAGRRSSGSTFAGRLVWHLRINCLGFKPYPYYQLFASSQTDALNWFAKREVFFFFTRILTYHPLPSTPPAAQTLTHSAPSHWSVTPYKHSLA